MTSASSEACAIKENVRCTMETRFPSPSRNTLRNCFDRALLDSGHNRVPEPPERRMM